MEIFQDLRKEYLEGMATYNEEEEILIGVPDLTVWFYNRYAENSLPYAKAIWESTEKSPTGQKSLDTFLHAYADRLLKLHRRYKLLLANARETQSIVNQM
jgi:hypothetical protein